MELSLIPVHMSLHSTAAHQESWPGRSLGSRATFRSEGAMTPGEGMCFLPSPPPGTHGILEGPVRSFLRQEHVPTTTERGHESRGLQAGRKEASGIQRGTDAACRRREGSSPGSAPPNPLLDRRLDKGKCSRRHRGQRPGRVSQRKRLHGCPYRRCLEGKALECPSQAIKSLTGFAEVLPSRPERNR